MYIDKFVSVPPLKYIFKPAVSVQPHALACFPLGKLPPTPFVRKQFTVVFLSKFIANTASFPQAVLKEHSRLVAHDVVSLAQCLVTFRWHIKGRL